VSLNSSRASHVAVVAVGAGRRTPRFLAALLVVLGLFLSTAACGMNVQTSKPYTPAEGTNIDVGGQSGDSHDIVHVRNLLIISRAPGQGILSGSLICDNSDALTGVTGVPYKVNGADGAPFTATLGSPVPVAGRTLVVLTGVPLIILDSADIAPGLDATVTLQFKKAGTATLRVPVMDGNEPQYKSITPSPSPTPSD
jgi:hypothetical protein